MLEIETLKASLPPDGELIDFVLVSNLLAWPGFAPSAYRLVAFVERRGRQISRLDLGPI
jgi:hypothetical protein